MSEKVGRQSASAMLITIRYARVARTGVVSKCGAKPLQKYHLKYHLTRQLTALNSYCCVAIQLWLTNYRNSPAKLGQRLGLESLKVTRSLSFQTDLIWRQSKLKSPLTGSNSTISLTSNLKMYLVCWTLMLNIRKWKLQSVNLSSLNRKQAKDSHSFTAKKHLKNLGNFTKKTPNGSGCTR